MRLSPIIVSNRLPLSLSIEERGELSVRESAGGLVTGLRRIHEEGTVPWVGYPGVFDQDPHFDRVKEELLSRKFVPVRIRKGVYQRYYNGGANSALWPLFHYFPEAARFVPEDWQAYEEVNGIFADTVLEVAKPGAWVWIHDYHLMLLPRILRRARPDLKVAYFHHIPFPSSEIFRLLPARSAVLRGLLGADLIGFHTYDYVRHFCSSVTRILGCEARMDEIFHEGRSVRVGAFPLGIDSSKWSRLAEEDETAERVARLREDVDGRQVLLGIDRLDYSKGIPERLRAFQTFLRQNEEFQGKVTLIQLCVPSRSEVKAYGSLKTRVERLVGEINGEFGKTGYTPVRYMYRGLPAEEVIALYRLADVMLVTPLRDGLNLVSKEYVASRTDNDGVLILSEFAGAATEMAEAVMVNPFDLNDLVHAMRKALTMPERVRKQRLWKLRSRILKLDNAAWADEFTARWKAVCDGATRSKELTLPTVGVFRAQVRKAVRTFVFMNCDGVLVPFMEDPKKARPSEAMRSLLRSAAEGGGREIALLSGRTRGECEEILGDLDLHLFAEHGLFYRARGSGEWEDLGGAEDFEVIKPDLLNVLELNARSLEGAWIEVKECTIVWHYRRAREKIEDSLVQNIHQELLELLAGTAYTVHRENLSLDIRPAAAHKGKVVERILGEKAYHRRRDMLVTMGSEASDDDMYRVRAAENHSIHVGGPRAYARWFIHDQSGAGPFLERLFGIPSALPLASDSTLRSG